MLLSVRVSVCSYRSPRTPSEAFLHTVAVLPEWRQHGLGTALVCEFLDRAKTAGCTTRATVVPFAGMMNNDEDRLVEKAVRSFFEKHFTLLKEVRWNDVCERWGGWLC